MADQQNGSEAEDIPSDFFDDFSKDEFMEGLNVVDSWNDEGEKRSRIAEAVDSVQDLRELIEEGSERRQRDRRRSRSIDDYIKPGSRRDPSKTNEAIRRDKAVKVKEQLTKHLEATDDLRPPGTELDDFFDETKKIEKLTKESSKSQQEDKKRESPAKRRRRSHHRSPRRSPLRGSPVRRGRRSPSPIRPGMSRYSNRFPRRLSPVRLNHYSRHGRRSRSPRRSPRRLRRSRSRERRSRSRDRHLRRSRSLEHHDSFLYPREDPFSEDLFPRRDAFPDPGPYPGGAPPGYQFGPGVQFPGPAMPVPYGEYGVRPMPPTMPDPMMQMQMGMQQPLPMPAMVPAPAPVMPPMQMPAAPPMVSAPPMVPAPQPLPEMIPALMDIDVMNPNDPLAKLVAEGKLSREDYLKLAPNKSATTNNTMDIKTRVDALTRCDTALSRLKSVIETPNQLLMNLSLFSHETKAIAPKFCSPLKRQVSVDFHFTTPSVTAAAIHNKQLLDAIVAKVGLTNVVARPKKKAPKNMKDAAVQTSKPYCDVCAIREATQMYDTGTKIDVEYFKVTVETQVVESELQSTRAFGPGSAPGGNPLSIAHLTPAQLVSQLAARAKTLKRTEPQPPPNRTDFPRPGGYEFEGRGPYQDNGREQFPDTREYPDNIRGPYPDSTRGPYPDSTRGPYPDATRGPYPDNSRGPYPDNSRGPPYPDNIRAPYPDNSRAPYPNNYSRY